MPVSRNDNVEIFYEKAGSGPALVMLHAMPFDHNLWLFQVAHFSSRFATIAIDLRGWGRSGKPTNPFSLRDMADDVMAVLADEGVESNAVIMGCSFGSKIALLLALDHSDVFDAAILVGGNSGLQDHLGPHIAIYREHSLAGKLQDYHRIHLRRGVTQAWANTPLGRYLIEGFVERGKGLDADSIARVFEAIMHSDLTDRLATLRVPILIVNGEHDSAFASGARTAGLIAGAERQIIAGAGHCCFLEEPDRFDAVMQAFLTSKQCWPEA